MGGFYSGERTVIANVSCSNDDSVAESDDGFTVMTLSDRVIIEHVHGIALGGSIST